MFDYCFNEINFLINEILKIEQRTVTKFYRKLKKT